MSSDWGQFTPISALVGGAIIGIASAIFVLFGGRIAGISGIIGGLLRFRAGDRAWRWAFIAGLLAAPIVYTLVISPPALRIDASFATLVVAGVLVGVGTRYATGCTSGHGVCGISRGSPRSIVATLTFMAAGFATVFVARHLLGSG